MATSGDTEMATPEYFHLPYDDDKFEGVIVGDLSYYASTDAQYSFTELCTVLWIFGEARSDLYRHFFCLFVGLNR